MARRAEQRLGGPRPAGGVRGGEGDGVRRTVPGEAHDVD